MASLLQPEISAIRIMLINSDVQQMRDQTMYKNAKLRDRLNFRPSPKPFYSMVANKDSKYTYKRFWQMHLQTSEQCCRQSHSQLKLPACKQAPVLKHSPDHSTTSNSSRSSAQEPDATPHLQHSSPLSQAYFAAPSTAAFASNTLSRFLAVPLNVSRPASNVSLSGFGFANSLDQTAATHTSISAPAQSNLPAQSTVLPAPTFSFGAPITSNIRSALATPMLLQPALQNLHLPHSHLHLPFMGSALAATAKLFQLLCC